MYPKDDGGAASSNAWNQDKGITVTKWSKKDNKSGGKQIKNSGAWAKPKGTEEEIAEAALVAEKSAKGKEVKQEVDEAGRPKAPESRRRKVEIPPPTTGPAGTTLWDLKGEGECGLRCWGAQTRSAWRETFC